MARLVSLILLGVMIVFLTIMFFHIVAPYLLPLFLAAVVAVLSQPVFRYFFMRTGQRTRLAAALTTASIVAAVLVPIGVGTFMASVQLYAFATYAIDDPRWVEQIKGLRARLDAEGTARWIEEHLGSELKVDTAEIEAQVQRSVRAVLQWIGQKTLGLAASTLGILGWIVSLLISLLIFIVGLYYMLADGPSLLAATEELIPVHREYQRQILAQFNQVMRAVILATFVAALAQGVATAVGLVLVGFSHFFVFAAVATLAALIPLAGTWIVWMPCAVWLASHGQWGRSVFLVLYGLVFVSTLDNVIRTYVLQSNARLHPLLAFVSVLGGLQVMGLWGVFIGPMVASCLHALVQIFNGELQAFSIQRLAALAGGSTSRAPAPSAAAAQEQPTPASAGTASPAAAPTSAAVQERASTGGA